MADDPRPTSTKSDYSPLGFHVSRAAWRAFGLGEALPAKTYPTIPPGVLTFRKIALGINRTRSRSPQGGEPVDAGNLMSADLLLEILRFVWDTYSVEQVPQIIDKGLVALSSQRDDDLVEETVGEFTTLFPCLPRVPYRATRTKKHVVGPEDDVPPLPARTRELALLTLSASNRALGFMADLFDDAPLKARTTYPALVAALEAFLASKPAFEPLGEPLFRVLRAPMEASPDDLEGQLEYIMSNWAHFLPEELASRLTLVFDVLKEERAFRIGGVGTPPVLEFGGDDYPEHAAFSRDADWMSNVVLMAKSTYVWLDQLSKKYERPITHLDQIPDEELDTLARWGFSGLWLIGLWRRSPASKRLKQWMGNPDAEASAYSLHDYTIAEELGGEEAFQRLKERAWARGIRLAGDMVPNHMGIDSTWVTERPELFLQLPHSPYPNYQFSCENLAGGGPVGVHIEDGYWSKSDAAVVFKWVDHSTGDTRYIYHGNDGTSMPWNDTAQLDFLNPDTREAVIRTIIDVARRFPIIRFDAAMTLAKKHIQRLWYPKPGDAGAIPSRVEHGMSREEFDARIPKEFWREVVDRVAEEVPDTLLLAEAFWLMEGYFVRTLGMHRVYNSAFMNMLKMEENAKYRATVKNVVEFSPEIIKRFVNFMNNPDERTAVEQFGKGDKYFGVMLMMVTMPGLPMVGHGQVEGFTEKYGMEYRRAYYDESADRDLVDRHEREIFPLMRRRKLFSGAENFAMYDFETDGGVDENVFAYSNRHGDERALILYNNAYNQTRGWVRTSSAINVAEGTDKHLVRKSLGEGLTLSGKADHVVVFREHRQALDFVRPSEALARDGMFAELGAYEFQAFVDFREIHDVDGSWWRLMERLGGRGVPSLEEERIDMVMEPLHQAYQDALRGVSARLAHETTVAMGDEPEETAAEPTEALDAYLTEIRYRLGLDDDGTETIALVTDGLHALPELLARAGDELRRDKGLVATLVSDTDARPRAMAILAGYGLLRLVGELAPEDREGVMDEWRLERATTYALTASGWDGHAASVYAGLVAMLARLKPLTGSLDLTADLLERDDVARVLGINEHEGTRYLAKDRLELLIDLLLLLDVAMGVVELPAAMERATSVLTHVEAQGYTADGLVEALELDE